MIMMRRDRVAGWTVVASSFFTSLIVALQQQHSACAMMVSTPTTTTTTTTQQSNQSNPSSSTTLPLLSGNWDEVKMALRDPECCVVQVRGLDHHLAVLQHHWADAPPAEIDLRSRIRVRSSTSPKQTYHDCLNVRHAVTLLAAADDEEEQATTDDDPCTVALQELARGVALLTEDSTTYGDGSNIGEQPPHCRDVFLRVVCASSYKARDPMFHTDKAPLRGYVTLRGPGTDYMTRTCSPLEYITLRGLGCLPDGSTRDLRQAQELEFIVMKGDHYYRYDDDKSDTTAITSASATQKTPPSWKSRPIWKRSFACVHRSPLAAATTGGGQRRVIISLDLADGEDDREWYEAGKQRTWRSGMTQRKSRLVA